MGLLNKIKHSLGLTTEQDESAIYKLFYVLDEYNNIVTSFNACSSILNIVYIYLNTRAHCKVQHIETLEQNKKYNLHVIDEHGISRIFHMYAI